LLAASDPTLLLFGMTGIEVVGLAVAALVVLALACIVACFLSPGLVRFPARLWCGLVYGLRVLGREHVPANGGALLVSNHVSFADWILLIAAQCRVLRFVIFAAWARSFGLRRLMRWGRVIPIDAWAGPRAMVQSLRAGSAALQEGDLVCIYPEGRMTRNGSLGPFHRGFERIAENAAAPIIPVYLDQLWGTLSSFYGGRTFWKWPRRRRYPAYVAFGPPLAPTTPAGEVRQAMQKLAADCAWARNRTAKPVHRQFVRTAARHPFRKCFIDSTTGMQLNYGMALTGAMILTRRLRPILGGEPMVGLWLPSSLGGAITNITVALLGKTAVNLNYTSSAEAVQSAIRQCGIKHVLTSRQFTQVKPLEVGPDVQLVYLEDFRKTVSRWERVRTFLSVVLLPGFVLERWLLGLTGKGHQLDDLATVIFSSGSTGEPKGIMLTHANIAANAESMVQVVDLRASDRALGVLPFFHSFGYTVTLWVPLQIGASIVYHPDPRQAKKIGELCRTHRCTIFLTTPTFLRFCLRQCDAGDFATVRHLASGAEKLPRALTEEFHKKFGVLPLEAYGCTELSPAAAANVPDRTIEGFTQIGNKPGTIGQPLPGVAARVVDPDTFETLPVGQEGLLLMFGPNVMKGYLGREDATRQVVRDGWYVTGDKAKIDDDGFITLTGRLSRFAKVGGEMVPLERVEEELHGVLETSERILAVTCVPDEARGERLVVLHTPLNGRDIHGLCQQLAGRGLPNLWLPSERDFFQVPELPLLGSGKVNLQQLKEMALERARR
jgi:acyl-[acyl-carrier-protein]-phospholipid O-acyltransferase/long-chain-fatty-acid--[acyl-carrier-protein] ligase